MKLVSAIGVGSVSVEGEEVLSLQRGSYEIKLVKISKIYALIFRHGANFELTIDTSKTALMEKIEEYKKIAKIE